MNTETNNITSMSDTNPPTAAAANAALELPADAAAPSQAGDAKTKSANTDSPKRPHSKKSRKPPQRPAAKKPAGPTGNTTSKLAERLLATFAIPTPALDRKLLPAGLLAALDAAGLGARESLPGPAFMMLATLPAIAGPGLAFAPLDKRLQGKLGTWLGLGIRICAIASDRSMSVVPEAILAAAYAAENDLRDQHQDAVAQYSERRRAAEQRRKLHARACEAAVLLGTEPPPPLKDIAISAPRPTPQIVVQNGAIKAIRTAASGGTGLLVVDERWMKSLCNVGSHYDADTARLLNCFAMGRAAPVQDENGRTALLCPHATVFGLLTGDECSTLHRARAEALAGTVFVPAVAPSPGGDGAGLVAMARRVRILAETPVSLHLSAAAAGMLVEAARGWIAIANAALPPLSDYCRGLADLARRLAVADHLAVAASGDDPLPVEIAAETVRRAVALVDSYILPVAHAALGPVSLHQQERDARRMIDDLRIRTSRDALQIERRRWYRDRQGSLPLPRFDAAAKLLQQASLLTATDPPEGEKKGAWFAAAPTIHAG
jgi:hypothetical protein